MTILANTTPRIPKFFVVSQKPHTDWENKHFESFQYEQAEQFALTFTGTTDDVFIKKVFVNNPYAAPAPKTGVDL